MASASTDIPQSSPDPRFGKTERPDHQHGPDLSRYVQEKTKIVELFALHVLPRNGEWQYAKDFIAMADVLDEEVKEDMLVALRALEVQEAKRFDPPYNNLLGEKDWARQASPIAQVDTSRIENRPSSNSQESVCHGHGSAQHTNSEKDFGIDDSVQRSSMTQAKKDSIDNSDKPNIKKPASGAGKASTKPKRPKPPVGMQKRSSLVVNIFYRLLAVVARSLRNHPAAIMRLVLLCTAVILALKQAGVRAQIGRLTGAGWDRLKRTVGMGVKISYI